MNVYAHFRRGQGPRAAPEPMPLEACLKRTLSNLGLDERLRIQRVLTAWSDVVGTAIAEAAEPVSIHQGELLVSVVNDSWRHRLTFERERIRLALNEAVGGDVVRFIRFRK